MGQSGCSVLEISLKSVKYLELAPKKKQLEVQNFLVYPYQTKADLEAILPKLQAERAEPDQAIGTSVWSSTLISKKITLPLLAPHELKAVIEAEAGKQLPFALSECQMDYYVIDENLQTKIMEVMLIAAKKDLIVERCKYLQKYGIAMRFMDIHPIALARLYKRFHGDLKQGVALIHVGCNPPALMGEENFVCILKNGVPVVLRDLNERLFLSAPATVERPAEATAPAEGQATALAPAAPTPATATPQAPTANFQAAASQIMNAVVFYENNFKEPVSRILLSGDSATCARMGEALLSQHRRKAEQWNILDQINFTDAAIKDEARKNEAGLNILLGLAARGIE